MALFPNHISSRRKLVIKGSSVNTPYKSRNCRQVRQNWSTFYKNSGETLNNEIIQHDLSMRPNKVIVTRNSKLTSSNLCGISLGTYDINDCKTYQKIDCKHYNRNLSNRRVKKLDLKISLKNHKRMHTNANFILFKKNKKDICNISAKDGKYANSVNNILSIMIKQKRFGVGKHANLI